MKRELSIWAAVLSLALGVATTIIILSRGNSKPAPAKHAVAAKAAPADPFILKQGTIRGEQYRLVRAVAGGRLYVLYFVHHQGVWFLIGSKQAATLSPGSMSKPKGPAS